MMIKATEVSKILIEVYDIGNTTFGVWCFRREKVNATKNKILKKVNFKKESTKS
jgi:hypothetical protein